MVKDDALQGRMASKGYGQVGARQGGNLDVEVGMQPSDTKVAAGGHQVDPLLSLCRERQDAHLGSDCTHGYVAINTGIGPVGSLG